MRLRVGSQLVAAHKDLPHSLLVVVHRSSHHSPPVAVRMGPHHIDSAVNIVLMVQKEDNFRLEDSCSLCCWLLLCFWFYYESY